MRFIPSAEFAEVFLVKGEPKEDPRGSFSRTYCSEEFTEARLNTSWPQHNLTKTFGEGSVRGMHFQSSPHEEIKVVRCLSGKVYDVVVDVRPQSNTFGKWQGFELSGEVDESLYIPKGFAHGFQCLAEECHLFYLMSDRYYPELSVGISCMDDSLGIQWPLDVRNLSDRDEALPTLKEISHQLSN